MNKPTETPRQNIIPAATTVIFRRSADGAPPELLMVTRSRNMTFAGGAAVFPGGRVDEADFDLAKTLGSDLPQDEVANRIAAIRETLEETGLAIGIVGTVDADTAREARELLLQEKALANVLEAMAWTIDLSAVTPFARWQPKNEQIPRVFDTRFYLVNLGTGAVNITVDATENTKLYWITAQGALDAEKRGDLTIIFPTRRNLERLAQFASFEDAVADCERFPVRTISPSVETRDGERWLCIPEGYGYPVNSELLETAIRS